VLAFLIGFFISAPLCKSVVKSVFGSVSHPPIGIPPPSWLDDYLLDEGAAYCYPFLMADINITFSLVYEFASLHYALLFYPKVRFSALKLAYALAFSVVRFSVSLEAF